MVEKLDNLMFGRHLVEDEEIYFVARNHWWFLIRSLLPAFFFWFVIPVFLWVLYMKLNFILLLLFVGVVVCIYRFFDWYGDAWVLTSQNLMDIEWDGFFKQRAQRLDYNVIESVDYEIDGVIATIFDYGRLVIETSNEEHNVLEHCTKPREAQKAVLETKNHVTMSDQEYDLETFEKVMHKLMYKYTNKKKKVTRKRSTKKQKVIDARA